VTAGDARDPSGAATTTGELRVVVIGLDGWERYGKPFPLEGAGSLTLESASRGVLAVVDADGRQHRFDLTTMRWL